MSERREAISEPVIDRHTPDKAIAADPNHQAPPTVISSESAFLPMMIRA